VTRVFSGESVYLSRISFTIFLSSLGSFVLSDVSTTIAISISLSQVGLGLQSPQHFFASFFSAAVNLTLSYPALHGSHGFGVQTYSAFIFFLFKIHSQSSQWCDVFSPIFMISPFGVLQTGFSQIFVDIVLRTSSFTSSS